MNVTPRISFLIPVYNEEKTLVEVVKRVGGIDIGGAEKEVVLVDDGSRDGSRGWMKAIEREPPKGVNLVKLVMQDRNRGKGAAVRAAIGVATGEYSVIQDADLEYDPRDVPALMGPLLDGRADAVFGSRFMGGPHRVLYFWHYVANRALTLMSNMVTNYNVSDMEVGYKAFRTDILKRLALRSDRFGIEPEIAARLARIDARLYEVPVSYSGRTYAEGKKITWRDGVAALWWIFRYRFFR